MLHTIAAHVPNVLPKWHFLRPAGRLIWASLLLGAGVAVILVLCKRPKPAEPATWAQAMLGAVASFALMLVGYGTVPHEWLTFANSYLKLNESKFLVRSGQKIIGPIHWLNFDVNKQTISHVIVAGMYVTFLALNVYLFAAWQKRPAAEAAEGAAPVADQPAGTSAYGRPLTAKG